jgi:predicted RNase H-like nuclease (RuvC/YqgF family)
LGAPKGGALLGFDALRACLNQQKDLSARRPGLEAERDKLAREKQELLQIDASLKVERANIEKLTASAADVNRRSKELAQQTADYNERAARFQSANLSGPTADRQRNALQREKAALDKNVEAFEAERGALGPKAEQAAKSYDARVASRDQSASDWNSRSATLNQQTQAYDVDLQNWKIDCEGRSYREDDEKLIQSGK